MQKALMALPSSPKLINVKAGNLFSGYVLIFLNQNIQNKNKLCVYFKGKFLHFQSSFSVLVPTLFHKARLCIDIRKLLLNNSSI